MKPRTLMLAMVAVGCGLAAAILASKLLSKPDQKLQAFQANKEIPKWTLLKDEDFFKACFTLSEPLEPTELPEEVRKSPAWNMEQIKSRLKDHILRKSFKKGDYLSMEDIVPRNQGGLASMLREGYTGYGVKVSAESA